MQKKVESLRKEILMALKEIESVSFLCNTTVLVMDEMIKSGINLFEEIKNMEIRLIKRALELTGADKIRRQNFLILSQQRFVIKFNATGSIIKKIS